MNTEYDYSVVRPVLGKSKLREVAYMIKGRPAPIIRKPTLYLRNVSANSNTGNIQNVYGNNVAAWKAQAQTLGASSMSRPSPGQIAMRRRHERETKTALRELGKLVRGQIHYYD